jgi:type II secretory pathway pseudopilin PulG
MRPQSHRTLLQIGSDQEFQGNLPSGELGFSLLEVLIATTIASLTLIALLQLLLVGFRAKIAARQRTEATVLAEKILQEYAQDDRLTTGRYQGESAGFRYLVQIEPQYEIPYAEAKSQVSCYLIQVTVAWVEKGKRKSIDLVTIRTKVQKKA